MTTRKNPADHYWYARNPSRFRRKTAHLSLTEVGAYDRLLDWYYENRRPLPREWVQMHRICGAVAPDEQAAVDKVVCEFFILEEDGWHNRTADEEIAKAQGISQKRAEAQAERERQRLARQGASGGANKGANAPANAPTTTTTIVDTSNDVSTPAGVTLPETFLMGDGTMLSLDGLFEKMWKLYPNVRDRGHKGKAKEELVKLLKKGIDYAIIGKGVQKYRRYCDSTGEKQPDFWRWLRDGGYDREYDADGGGKTAGGSRAGYSIRDAAEQAVRDTTRRPEGREDRLKTLGLHDDPSDV